MLAARTYSADVGYHVVGSDRISFEDDWLSSVCLNIVIHVHYMNLKASESLVEPIRAS